MCNGGSRFLLTRTSASRRSNHWGGMGRGEVGVEVGFLLWS